jgi:hypothetical protein
MADLLTASLSLARVRSITGRITENLIRAGGVPGPLGTVRQVQRPASRFGPDFVCHLRQPVRIAHPTYCPTTVAQAGRDVVEVSRGGCPTPGVGGSFWSRPLPPPWAELPAVPLGKPVQPAPPLADKAHKASGALLDLVT